MRHKNVIVRNDSHPLILLQVTLSCLVSDQHELFLIFFFFSIQFPKWHLEFLLFLLTYLKVLFYLLPTIFGLQGVDVEEKPCKMDTAKVFGANTPTVSCHFSRKLWEQLVSSWSLFKLPD